MPSQLLRFALVGMLGTCVNMSVFLLAVKWLMLSYNFAATAAFLLAVGHNFALNRIWTFHVHGRKPVRFAIGWAKYVGVNLIGFAINLAVLNAVVAWFGHDFSVEGQAMGVVSGMLFNFMLSRAVVFKIQAGVPRGRISNGCRGLVRRKKAGPHSDVAAAPEFTDGSAPLRDG